MEAGLEIRNSSFKDLDHYLIGLAKTSYCEMVVFYQYLDWNDDQVHFKIIEFNLNSLGLDYETFIKLIPVFLKKKRRYIKNQIIDIIEQRQKFGRMLFEVKYSPLNLEILRGLEYEAWEHFIYYQEPVLLG